MERGQNEAQAVQRVDTQPAAGFKAKAALEAIRGLKTTNEIAAEFGVHPTQIGHWKRQVLESLPEIFANHRGRSGDEDAALRDRLYQQIGQLDYWPQTNLIPPLAIELNTLVRRAHELYRRSHIPISPIRKKAVNDDLYCPDSQDLNFQSRSGSRRGGNYF